VDRRPARETGTTDRMLGAFDNIVVRNYVEKQPWE
jgi:hypothetical protein